MNAKTQKYSRWAILMLALSGIAAFWTGNAKAADLSLLGYRWEKPAVTYWINAHGASTAAVTDVLTAIDDWNEALANPVTGVPAAPVFVMASSSRKADIVFDLKVTSTRNHFGSRLMLTGEETPSLDGCEVVAEQIVLRGIVLNDGRTYAQTRNLVRRLVGHALGLGNIVCPFPTVGCGTSDVMDVVTGLGALWDALPDYDLSISPCDLFGIATIYGVPSCEDIPDSVPYDCD